jgi:hypothetical protein
MGAEIGTELPPAYCPLPTAPCQTQRSDTYAANFRSLIASKSCTPPPTRLVV